VLATPGSASIRTHRTVMSLLMLAGIVGLYYHYQGNAEFELELYPSIAGTELFWKSIKGATPALAPLATVYLGVLGLVATFRYPKTVTNRQELLQ
jgi:hypothetical protein